MGAVGGGSGAVVGSFSWPGDDVGSASVGSAGVGSDGLGDGMGSVCFCDGAGSGVG